ncbi:hypothetical protein CYMTET_22228 [Cymbomonas tetramitiformis]|uniref:Uncharacterized protein n=1 Tax=Cymbomonas tetramitiformis TaxID=36881 RepID=A0AAE0L2C8_9CHLO|nr:hypothetical protein CYMTET_22228 [Cymbomonas tetramitiformis]
MRRARSYGVVFRPEVFGDSDQPRCHHMDFRASLVMFPDIHSACHLPGLSDSPSDDEWLLPHVVVQPEDLRDTADGSGTPFSSSHISLAHAERLHDQAAPQMPLRGGSASAACRLMDPGTMASTSVKSPAR